MIFSLLPCCNQTRFMSVVCCLCVCVYMHVSECVPAQIRCIVISSAFAQKYYLEMCFVIDSRTYFSYQDMSHVRVTIMLLEKWNTKLCMWGPGFFL
jgi:hypothetical protein